MNLTAAREGVSIALDALRSNRVRAALTILGVVIGVATVMAMAAMIGGIRSSITGQLEALGPKNFIMDRFDQTQVRIVTDGTGGPPWEGKPSITMDEAALIAELPSIQSVTPSVSASADIKYGTRTIDDVSIRGQGYEWPNYSKGDFVAGRNFLPTAEKRSSAVIVLSEGLAESLFGQVAPIGKAIRVGGDRFHVIGVYKQEPNLFSGAADRWAVVPPSTAIKRLDADEEWLSLLIVPTAAATQTRAMDDVTSLMRTTRGLRPGEENNFALMRQEAFLELFNRITGAFFLIMLVLSSIGLMVGGVGVVAIMMISVTERTREIGVRKALGATRREILWQFLVESMTVTVIGGVIGMALGGGGAFLLSVLTPIPAAVPLWSIVAALAVSAITGIGFGLYPANKAARLDPVDALRYE
ncbi:MAG TPA: ABC transporter permease [Longimicrobiaceae bacterium]|nr:ABC transporter permease [Longimicrobiaceae bacterium]